MKKLIVILLFILPFVLMYFISFTGQIFSTYNHVYVERIAILDDNNNEYSSGDSIKCEPEKEYDLKIKIFPELATDKSVIISNSNKEVCQINSESYKITTLKNGESKVVITSVDRHYVQFVINIVVTQDDIQDFLLDSTSVDLTIGKIAKVDVTIIPDTALQENRVLIWESANKSIATVSNDGVIRGVGVGNTTITVYSASNPNLVKTIIVNVTLEYGKGIFFVNPNPNQIFESKTSEFDLKSIIVVNLDDVNINDAWFQIGAINEPAAVDISRIGDGVIAFREQGKWINVIVKIYTEEQEYEDDITIWYKP